MTSFLLFKYSFVRVHKTRSLNIIFRQILPFLNYDIDHAKVKLPEMKQKYVRFLKHEIKQILKYMLEHFIKHKPLISEE